MQDDSNTSDQPASGSVSEDTPSITTFEMESELEIEFNGSTYTSSADIESLEERLSEVEEQEAAGLETEEASNVLRARLELAKAKANLEHEEKESQVEAVGSATRASQSQPTLAASRILQPTQKNNALANCLQYSSSICAVAGGVLLSSNTSVSKYGFIFLACSSSQIFLSSMLLKQKSLMLYGASLFILVDCLGIYRWILTGTP